MHYLSEDALKAIFRRAASAGWVVTKDVTDRQLLTIFESDREDGWCKHDIEWDALKAIFKRAAICEGGAHNRARPQGPRLG
ncbi:hypothetical protein SAMN05216576_107103 [Ectopseudomonas chengduensis]|uniref:Uncharacterized protein n=2 Tax=Ectopseudomonas TaxID=3236654 RepID=A0A1G6PUG9_9GAMM|nr:hypothetical protein SAMN05216576_107103 [Pseudomonas chengduensis]